VIAIVQFFPTVYGEKKDDSGCFPNTKNFNSTDKGI